LVAALQARLAQWGAPPPAPAEAGSERIDVDLTIKPTTPTEFT
jgi:hypothetical protein